MKKYGEGLGIEFARAVQAGAVPEPFSTSDVRKFAEGRGWAPSPKYIAVLLANSSSPDHSLTYQKLFESIGEGLYRLSK